MLDYVAPIASPEHQVLSWQSTKSLIHDTRWIHVILDDGAETRFRLSELSSESHPMIVYGLFYSTVLCVTG